MGTEIMSSKGYVEFMAGSADAYKLLAEKGEHFTSRVPVKSVPVAKEWAKRERPKPGVCFMNAQKFVWYHPDAKYYEGFWMGHGVPVHHGWVVLDGVVIDFTAEACDRKLQREGIIPKDGTDDSWMDYFGVHIPTDRMLEIVFRSKMWGGIMWTHLLGRDVPCLSD